MFYTNQITYNLSNIQDKKSLTLHWRSFDGGSSDVDSSFLSILADDTVIIHYRDQASTALPNLQAQK